MRPAQLDEEEQERVSEEEARERWRKEVEVEVGLLEIRRTHGSDCASPLSASSSIRKR